MTEKVLIIDFGSQLTQLIARRIRETGVYCEIISYNNTDNALKKLNPRAIILSGGPSSIVIAETPRAPNWVFESGVPVLGICYGYQTMIAQLGGEVKCGCTGEFGRTNLDIIASSPLFEGVWQTGNIHQVWMSHSDLVTRLPDGFDVIAVSPGTPFAAVAHRKRSLYGVQFHPEAVHTIGGAKILANFVNRIAGLKSDWSMEHFRHNAVLSVRAKIGNKRVICGLSGGIDSSVVALLLHEAVGTQLICIFIDNGLLRLDEPTEIVSLFREHFNIPLIHVKAAPMFLTALSGVTDPEQKRKIIGRLFIEIFEDEASKLGGVEFLAQGTLHPDVIESISSSCKMSATIKSHHNVGGLPERMKLKLVEPLRELFKDEVRTLGRELGLPEHFVDRHPFPGPGLAIRIPGKITTEKIDILRHADFIYLDEIRKAGLYNKIWQAFAVLLPVKTVGVMGDER
ncbi:MAG: glutamine-hydrolyzing GMP synthase, partial [Hyphomicrobiaceae bacterium]|nr:glutamine-hydrolyzing GMP synthase [Hyphomicrobiaceae bacterium]